MTGNLQVKYKRSRQRERILELLQSTTSHPTAAWIYDRLKTEFPDLSMGTVYRNLGILVEQGLVQKMEFGATFDRYDAGISPHYHFVCEKCGNVIDLPLPEDDELNQKVDRETGFKTRRHRIEFYGDCDRCK